MRKLPTPLVAALLTALALAGCGAGEPSESDMKDAIKKNAQFQQGMKALQFQAMGRGLIVDSSEKAIARLVVQKEGCVAATGEQGFQCDFRWGEEKRDAGNIVSGLSSPMKRRFFKSSHSGWEVVWARQ